MIGTVSDIKKPHRVWIGLGALFAPVFCLAMEFDGSVELASQASYSRLKIALDESFRPRIESGQQGFKIVIPAATLMDLGVPFGAEEKFNDFLKGISDERLVQLKVREKEDSLVLEGKYRFPTGSKALARPAMEHFDFRRDDQGKFVVDFFYRKGPTRGDVERETRARELARLQAEREAIRRREAEKKESKRKRIEDGRNALLFCERPFNRQSTVFLRFRAEHSALDLSNYFPEKIPDHRYEYPEPKGAGEEFDMIRLALKLSRENQHALSIKTVEFLDKQYPKSRYRNEMAFLKANAYFRLGLEDQGRDLIRDIAKRAKGTEVGLQASGFIAAQSFQKKEWLSALESFLALKKEMPKHPLLWLFRYGIAECLYQIRQSEQAIEEYQWLAQNAPKPEVRAEAAFKAGDAHFERGQYAQAATSYEAAVRKHNKELPHYPLVLLNLGESYFQLEESQRSVGVYKRFIEIARNQPSAWKASLRIAEITAMNEHVNSRAEGALIGTINQYPLSPGALVARLRLLPCGSHGGFDLPAAERFISSPEVKNFSGEGAVYDGPFRDLVALTEVRMLISFHEDLKAVEKALEHLRANPGVDTRKMIEQAMIGGVKNLIEKKVAENDPFGAIALYEKYGDFLPLPAHDPLADELKMKIAAFAAERNLTTLAKKIIEPFRLMNEASQREVIAAIEKRLTLEGAEDQESRSLIEAKTLWNSPEFKLEDAKSVEYLTGRLAFVRDGSKFAVERDLILGLLHWKKKDSAKAGILAGKVVDSSSGLGKADRCRILGWAGDVAIEAQDLEFAEKAYRTGKKLREQVGATETGTLGIKHLGALPSLAYFVLQLGETLEKQEKWKEAVALYSEASENKIGGNRVLYAHARALLKDGGKDSRIAASRSLEKIQQSQEDDVWKKLAKDTLSEIAKEGKVDEKRNP